MSHRIGLAALGSFALALAACGGDPAGPSTMPETSRASSLGSVGGIWRQQPSLLPARRWAAATVSGKSILVIGGEVNGEVGSSSRVDAYNVETRKWTRLAPLPEGRMWHDATTIGGKVYVAGGENESIIDGVPTGTPTHTLFVYDPGTNSWSRKADLPVKGTQIVHQAAVSGVLYVYTDNDHFWKYSPWLDKWTALPLPPSPHGDGMMKAIGGKLYLTGGIRFTGTRWEYNPELDVYEPATRTWTVKSPLPAAYSSLDHGAVAASFRGKLWVAGGAADPSGPLYNAPARETYAYDPLTDTWVSGPPMLRATMNAAGAWAGGKFYVFGGNDSSDLTQVTGFVQALSTSY
jgi:N-acetylneuraminic acid mutarotase